MALLRRLHLPGPLEACRELTSRTAVSVGYMSLHAQATRRMGAPALAGARAARPCISREGRSEQAAMRLQAAAPAGLRLRRARQRRREARAVLDAHLAPAGQRRLAR